MNDEDFMMQMNKMQKLYNNTRMIYVSYANREKLYCK